MLTKMQKESFTYSEIAAEDAVIKFSYKESAVEEAVLNYS